MELLFLYLGLGVMFIALGIPLAQRRIRPNRWYGFRFPATMTDPFVWYDVNAYGGRIIILMGAAIIIAASLLSQAPSIDEKAYALSMSAVMLLSIAIMMVLSVLRMRKAIHEAHGKKGTRR